MLLFKNLGLIYVELEIYFQRKINREFGDEKKI